MLDAQRRDLSLRHTAELEFLEAEGDARLPAEAPRLRAEVVVDELERGVEAVVRRGVGNFLFLYSQMMLIGRLYHGQLHGF